MQAQTLFTSKPNLHPLGRTLAPVNPMPDHFASLNPAWAETSNLVQAVKPSPEVVSLSSLSSRNPLFPLTRCIYAPHSRTQKKRTDLFWKKKLRIDSMFWREGELSSKEASWPFVLIWVVEARGYISPVRRLFGGFFFSLGRKGFFGEGFLLSRILVFLFFLVLKRVWQRFGEVFWLIFFPFDRVLKRKERGKSGEGFWKKRK